jgi:hypothetical protein
MPVQAAIDVKVVYDINRVIQADEIEVCHRPIQQGCAQNQNQTNETGPALLLCEHRKVILRGKAEILKAEIGNQDGGARIVDHKEREKRPLPAEHADGRR